MFETDEPLPAPWHYYSHRATEAHRAPADDFGQGREEQLGKTLEHIESGKSFTDGVRDSLDRMPHNRAKKHRRLRRKLQERLRCEGPGYLGWADDEDAQLLDRVHVALTPAEWAVECRLAYGETYAEIADGVLPVTALKMRVSRWRARVRETVAV